VAHNKILYRVPLFIGYEPPKFIERFGNVFQKLCGEIE